MVEMAYASVQQQARVLAQDASRLLPGHPALHAPPAYGHVSTIAPTKTVDVPRANGGTVRLGPGTPHLYLFFDTWVSETMNLRAHLEALNDYEAFAKTNHLPQLTAIDEASVEPTPTALHSFLASLPHPLTYPIAIDQNGGIADGYRVQDQPWLALVSSSGQLLWYHDISAAGWPATNTLAAKLQAALTRNTTSPTTNP